MSDTSLRHRVSALGRRAFGSLRSQPAGEPAAAPVAAVAPSSHSDALVAQSLAAPFPPEELMFRVSALKDNAIFALHARDIYAALAAASPRPLRDYASILDFGVGAGRLARMFEGFSGQYVGADVDHELVAWVERAHPWVTPLRTIPRRRLPCADASFDCIISVSVFTHLNEADTLFYLDELHRVAKPGAVLMLTRHGERALLRAESEAAILSMLAIPQRWLALCRARIDAGGMFFVLQPELTSAACDYGITFTSEAYVREKWAERLALTTIVSGAIHDFQDIVVLRKPETPAA